MVACPKDNKNKNKTKHPSDVIVFEMHGVLWIPLLNWEPFLYSNRRRNMGQINKLIIGNY